MKIQTTIELTGHDARRWATYQAVHSFLKPSNDMMVTALVQAGLKAYMKHHEARQTHKLRK